MEKENIDINEIITHQNTIQDKSFADKIELRIQKDHNISIPSIILEFIQQENSEKKVSFELSNLKNFFDNFGEVLNIVILKEQVVVLFKTFFIAYICKEFLEKEKHFYNGKKDCFKVRWFDFQRDSNLLMEEIRQLFEKIYNKNIINIKPELKEGTYNLFRNNNTNNNIGIKMNMNMNINNFNINATMNPMGQTHNPMFQSMGVANMQNIGMNQIGMNLQQQQYLQQLMKMNKNNISLQNVNPAYLMQLAQTQNIMKNGGMNMPINKQNDQNNPINNFNNKMMYNLNPNNAPNNINNLNNNSLNKNFQILSQINPQLVQNQFKNFQQMANHHSNNINDMNNINKPNLQSIIKNNQNMNNSNSNEDKNFGKYTCKYEILIANDKDFQIARRLIGSKGCNMKNIINECKSGPDDADKIKLRLRGRGSGYKEGPDNKESEEPLHLCISAKNPEDMKKACLLVDDLLDKIHGDYKKYCQENNVNPIDTKIAMRIESKNFGYNGK